MNIKQELLATIDVPCFLEHLDPDWKEHFTYYEDGESYHDTERAFDFYTEYMEPQELLAALKESGCR